MKRSLENVEYKEGTEALAKFAKALGHPTRIAILKHLENQSCCFTGDLVDVLPISQSTVSQHLKELKNAGFNSRRIKTAKNKILYQSRKLEDCKNLISAIF